ncbi:MAG: YkgJ family cysteine cluster protein [Halieaceae bacterium]
MKECNQCGKCCIAYADGGLSATPEEIESWQVFEPGIARYVVDGQIWMDPATGQQLDHCPWLEVLPRESEASPARYGCRIYHHRPQDCRQYPVTVADMVRDGCEMIEAVDLQSPKGAQLRLDRLMAESRPPIS